jgi:hypothetical protein
MITYFLNWGKARSRKKEFHDARGQTLRVVSNELVLLFVPIL